MENKELRTTVERLLLKQARLLIASRDLRSPDKYSTLPEFIDLIQSEKAEAVLEERKKHCCCLFKDGKPVEGESCKYHSDHEKEAVREFAEKFDEKMKQRREQYIDGFVKQVRSLYALSDEMLADYQKGNYAND